MRREQEGVKEVIAEITGNQEKWGPTAGVTAAEVAGIVTSTAQIAQIRLYRPAVAKLLEMLDETEAMLEDKRDTLIRTVAGSVDVKAMANGGEATAKHEKTRAYRSASGDKAAKARKKNAKDAKRGCPERGQPLFVYPVITCPSGSAIRCSSSSRAEPRCGAGWRRPSSRGNRSSAAPSRSGSRRW